MRAANDNTIAWGGWALIAAAMAVGLGMLLWSVGGWLRTAHLFSPVPPEEISAPSLPDGAMTSPMAGAIFRQVGSEEEARAMTAATRGPLRPDDLKLVIRSRRRFVDAAARYGFSARRADDGFWMITSIYRVEGDGQKLREIMNRIDPA